MGREVAIVLRTKRELAPSVRAGLLYDDSGDAWPRCSLLIATFDGFTHEPTSAERRAAKDYFGRSATIGAGRVTIPPRSLSGWRRVGDVTDIFYDRAGTKAPGYFHHRFHKPRGLWKLLFLFKPTAAKAPVVLYQRRGAYRLELPDGCIVDDRGIALP
jgi:hypothetical protein